MRRRPIYMLVRIGNWKVVWANGPTHIPDSCANGLYHYQPIDRGASPCGEVTWHEWVRILRR